MVIESAITLDSEIRREISECLKKFKLIHPKFVGKIICNTNQGGITSIVQSVKMTKEELGSWLMADGGENDKNRKS